MIKTNSILLVEDDELDIISVQRSLKKLEQPHELVTAYNGIEAMAWLRQALLTKKPLPDVILLDLNMPRMNGIEFLRELRSEPKLKDTKVFVMTTSGEDTDRRAADELGVTGYIIKPLNFNNNSKRNDSMDAFVQFHIRKIFS